MKANKSQTSDVDGRGERTMTTAERLGAGSATFVGGAGQPCNPAGRRVSAQPTLKTETLMRLQSR